MEEVRIDVTKQTKEQMELANHQAQLIHRFNHSLPFSEEWWSLQKVVTKSIPDYAVAVGNPAKVIKFLDKERFEEKEK